MLAALLRRAGRLEEPRVSVSEVTIKGWESGKHTPRGDMLRVLARVLDQPVELLVWLSGNIDSEEKNTKRSQFLVLLGAVVSGAVDLERLTTATADAMAARDAETVTMALMGQWYVAAPSMLYPPVQAHLDNLNRMLPGPPELEALTGRTALLAGHLLNMLSRPGEARVRYALAESLARDVGDDDLYAATLISRSALHDWRRGKDAKRSAELVEGAASVRGTSPAIRVWSLARRAEERAVAGDAIGFEHDMGAAEASLRATGEPWFGPRDATELAAFRGASELLLGRHGDAAATLSWTLERMDASAVNWRTLVAADRDRALAAR